MNERMQWDISGSIAWLVCLQLALLLGCAGQADQAVQPEDQRESEASALDGTDAALGEDVDSDESVAPAVGVQQATDQDAAHRDTAARDATDQQRESQRPRVSQQVRSMQAAGREPAERVAQGEQLVIEPPANSSHTPVEVRSATAAPLRVQRMTREATASVAPDTAAQSPQPQAPISSFPRMAADMPETVLADEEVRGAEPEAAVEPTTTKDSSQSPYDSVTVFYGTDRSVQEPTAVGTAANALGPLVVAASVTLLMLILSGFGWQRKPMLFLATVGLLVTLGLGGWWAMETLDRWQHVAEPGTRYGNTRGQMSYGTCEVTIPASHQLGEVERPSILRLEVREDVTKHVVLQATKPTQKDAFYDQLRARVASTARQEVFVFVHGYNVTFDGAARRTAQIAHDVQFQGAPIFFSWPSQGGLLQYTVDENNVEWAVPHLREFLVEITQRSGAKSVNLIAHSMGNRALTSALRELQLQLGKESALFNQIILAAPDIDAEIFRRDLAPALVQTGQRVTLYASSNDQALVASKKVHGYPRAGDAGAGLVVLPGIETIDVSTLDTSLLGHSYYGSSDPILSDIRQLIEQALPAAQRASLFPHTYGNLTYWVFTQVRHAAARDRTTTSQ